MPNTPYLTKITFNIIDIFVSLLYNKFAGSSPDKSEFDGGNNMVELREITSDNLDSSLVLLVIS